MKKDVTWSINGTEYKVLNVPYVVFDDDDDEFIDISVSIKLIIVRDLMVANEIPHTVNYDNIADIGWDA
jgi:hypothetical protein